ncbi:hypothetical protein [Paeniglutamicibacter kerguelensis]|uniref:DUF2975 domain-containing protein n=1 Tax=Paeniglutamicibacter kerguelensis TaxID=254788 RepID=A0ABS4XBK7_9MICC|nr:hypothetical protein [Paeniglutamicibacter kerguelensis]MBP2385850.1 hypothetical protein [Paeniglutamicibacter kerguelensis]
MIAFMEASRKRGTIRLAHDSPLPADSNSRILPLGAGAGAARTIGIVLLLFTVAAGALLIVSISRDFAPYARLTARCFSHNPVVTQWVDALARTHDRGRIVALQIAVSLWNLSPAPLILMAALTQHSPDRALWIAVGIAIILLVVAASLLVLLPTTWAHTVAETLNRAGKRSAAKDDVNDS